MASFDNGYYNFLLHGHEYRFDINWIVAELKRQGKIVDSIDERIQEAVDAAVSDEKITTIVENIISTLSGVVNVKIPPAGLTPAKGDGTVNDGAALQAILNYLAANNGGIAFFPQGAYLTDSLTIPANVSLFGLGRYESRLVAAGGLNGPVLSSTGGGTSIQNIEIDASMSSQVNNISAISLMGQNYLLADLFVNDAYTGIQFVGSGHFQAHDIVLTNIVNKGVITSGDNADVSMDNVDVLSGGSSVVAAFDISTVQGVYTDIRSTIAVNDYAILLAGRHNVVKAFVSGTEATIYDIGEGNSYDIYNDVIKLSLNNMQVNVSGDLSVAASHITEESDAKTVSVNGTLQENAANSNENISGTKRIVSDELILDPTNPLTYKDASELNEWFRYVPFKNNSGANYNVLVEKPNVDFNIFANVKNYGAKGDGATDDTAAITAAFNASNYVFFPAGWYVCSNALTPKSNSTIVFEDGGLLLNTTGSTVEDGVTYYSYARALTLDSVDNVKIYGLHLKGKYNVANGFIFKRTSTTLPDELIVYANNCNDLLLSDFVIEDYSNAFIGQKLNNSNFPTSTTDTENAVKICNCTNVTLFKHAFVRCSCEEILLWNCTNLNIVECYMLPNSYMVSQLGVWACHNTTLVNCSFVGATNGNTVNIYGGSVKVLGCYFETDSSINNLNAVSIDLSTEFENVLGYGTYSTDNCLVDSCIFINASIEGVTQQNDAEITSHNMVVSNCVFNWTKAETAPTSPSTAINACFHSSNKVKNMLFNNCSFNYNGVTADAILGFTLSYESSFVFSNCFFDASLSDLVAISVKRTAPIELTFNSCYINVGNIGTSSPNSHFIFNNCEINYTNHLSAGFSDQSVKLTNCVVKRNGASGGLINATNTPLKSIIAIGCRFEKGSIFASENCNADYISIYNCIFLDNNPGRSGITGDVFYCFNVNEQSFANNSINFPNANSVLTMGCYTNNNINVPQSSTALFNKSANTLDTNLCDYNYPYPAGRVRYSDSKLQYWNGSSWVDVPTS